MDPERWRRVTAIFDASLQREPAARGAFVAQACADDPSLLADVDALLRGDERARRDETFSANEEVVSSVEPGSRFGPYVVDSSIGAGGMGVVYKARDTRLDRTVAIKILPDTLAADPQFRERFDREARSLAALSHPHICPVFDVGQQDGIDFLVMEYLDGDTVEHRLKKGALPLDQALQYSIQIADALSAAHRAGVVHRDLKPGNIILTRSGAKLLDFGLAKTGAQIGIAPGLSMLPTTPPALTAHGTILGTFHYMAPEQLEGHEADARTDIFAFGAVLYEMVTGKKAFDGTSQTSVMAAILKREPPPLATAQPLAPPLLDRVVRKCLAKQSPERWQTAKDLHDELRWVAEHGELSDTAGRSEVYVAPFPGRGTPGGTWQVSTSGGAVPRWRRDGKEVFYLSHDSKLMAAQVSSQGSAFEVGTVRPLFEIREARPRTAFRGSLYDVSGDGQRFLVITQRQQAEATTAPSFTLVVNWTALLKK